MTRPNRSLLQVDLKDLTARPSTPVLSHLGLASVTAGALLVTYTLMNTPSVSTAATPTRTAPEITAITAITAIIEQGSRAESPAAEPAPIVLAGLGPSHSHPTDAGRPSTAGDHSPPRADLPSPAPAVMDEVPIKKDEVTHPWITAKVKRRDTLSRIFQRHGLKVGDAYTAAKLEAAAVLGKIRPGDEIRLATDDTGALAALRYRLDALSILHIDRADGRLRAEVITRTPEIRLRTEKAAIWTNLLDAARGAGIAFETIYDLAQLFAWQVDFAREIRPGDQFTVIYEELYLDNEKVDSGDILAAELITSKRHLRAIRHIDEQGRTTYYAPNGDGIQSSFLRSPIKFGRVTSHFSHRRFHPIFKQWRPHRGVDYGAPTGTPVRSTGDGVVTQAKHNRGYGNTVIIRHGGKYTTLYAHLNRFAKGIKSGVRVQQGDIIGYVGSTGWSTGPHLHYEFRVHGIHQNPLTAELPKSDPIDPKYRAEFLARATVWATRLDEIGATAVAQIDAAQSQSAQSQ